uniref:Uncharacterized protein n=1 Tax=Anguilla anguilla TaxID=7936 RepID=A0A0E9VPY4_ANGAN
MRFSHWLSFTSHEHRIHPSKGTSRAGESLSTVPGNCTAQTNYFYLLPVMRNQ